METLEDISQKMKNSERKEHFMKRILTQGIVKYERKVRNSKLEKEDSQYSPLHQPSGRCLKRLKKKAQARETWFRGDRDKGKDGKLAGRAFQKAGKSGMKSKILASTVMFIPSTKNGILLKMMKENEEKLVEMTGFRVSYAESGGTQLGRYFSPTWQVASPVSEKAANVSLVTERTPTCRTAKPDL